VTGYLVAIATLVGIRALLALGLNVQWGMTGLVNLGVVAFFGIGAYTSGLLAVAGVALPLAWAAALVTSGVAGAALCVAAAWAPFLNMRSAVPVNT
jgi:branched-chain amino acid transport system permease protein